MPAPQHTTKSKEGEGTSRKGAHVLPQQRCPRVRWGSMSWSKECSFRTGLQDNTRSFGKSNSHGNNFRLSCAFITSARGTALHIRCVVIGFPAGKLPPHSCVWSSMGSPQTSHVDTPGFRCFCPTWMHVAAWFPEHTRLPFCL